MWEVEHTSDGRILSVVDESGKCLIECADEEQAWHVRDVLNDEENGRLHPCSYFCTDDAVRE